MTLYQMQSSKLIVGSLKIYNRMKKSPYMMNHFPQNNVPTASENAVIQATVKTYARLTVKYSLDELILTTKVYSDALNYYFNTLSGEHSFDSETDYCYDDYEQGATGAGALTLNAESRFYLPGAKGMVGTAVSQGEHYSTKWGAASFKRTVLVTIK